MVKEDEGWTLPERKPVTKESLDRAISAEKEAASREHQAQEAWFDRSHGTVMVKLRDGRVFGAEPGFIPSLSGASPEQLGGLRASDDGVYLVVAGLDLHINVDGLVTDHGRGAAGHQAVGRAPCRASGLRPQRAVGRAPEVQAENVRAVRVGSRDHRLSCCPGSFAIVGLCKLLTHWGSRLNVRF